VAPPRRSRAGLVASVASLALLGVIASYPALATGDLAPFLALAGVGAAALLVAAFLLRLPGLVPWALVPLLGEYAAFLLLEGHDSFAPLVAAGVVLVAELAYWGLEPQALPARRVTVRRAGTLALVAVASAAVAAFVMGASRLDLAGGLGLEAIGVVAAVGALALLALLARERPRPADDGRTGRLR
jgi:hypothetical protein